MPNDAKKETDQMTLITRLSATLPGAVVRVAVLLTILFGASIRSEAQNYGEKSFGPKIGFNSRNTSALAGLTFECPAGKYVRIAPSIGLVFRHNNLAALTVDADVHFPISLSERWRFYPLAGLAFNSWSRNGINPESHDDVTTHSNGLGGNAGAGIEVRCKGALKLGLEAKYTLIRHYPNASVSARIAYVF